MASDRLHIVTGGPGAGKSTLIAALADLGIATSAEVGRAIIRDEMASGGCALPWADRMAFAERMAVREVAAHQAALAMGRTTVFDRGIPDVIGYLRVANLPVPAHIDAAARTCRYNTRVFIAPWWAEIYAADAERRQTPDEARVTFSVMAQTYRDYGYTLVELPRATAGARAAFVRQHLKGQGMIHRHLAITGRVQNVFYRDWMVEQALALGIDGWVRNRADGSVEAVACGAAELVDRFIARAREGSPASRVENVAVTDAPAEVHDDFAKRPTA